MNISDEQYNNAVQLTIFDVYSPDIFCGKTSSELCRQELQREKISESSLKKFAELRIKPPQYLCLTKESGQQAAALWEIGGALLGEYTTRSFGEYPSEERESHLSQILEKEQLPTYSLKKYHLSPRACMGILTRAERRGKQLPEMLRQALIRQATPLKSGGGSERDSSGRKAGKGALIQEELSGTLGVSQDQTLFCLNDQGGSVMNVSENVCGALRAQEHGHQPTICLEGNGSRPSHRGDGYIESDTMYTLNQTEQHGVCYGLDRASFNQGQNAKYDFAVEEEIAQPLVSRGPGGVLTEQLGPCAPEITKE